MKDEAMTQVPADSDLIAARKAPASLLRYFLAHGSSAAAIKLAAVILSYLFLILLARSVDEAEYGRYGFAISLTVFLGILANCGQGMAILRFWAQFQAKDDPARAKGAMLRSYLTVLIGAGGVVGLAFLGVALAKLLNPALDAGYLYAAAFLTFPSAIAAYQGAAMRALGFVARAMLPTDIFHRGVMVLALLYLLGSSLELSAELVLWISGGLWLVLLIPQAVRIVRETRRQAPAAKAVAAPRVAPGAVANWPELFVASRSRTHISALARRRFTPGPVLFSPASCRKQEAIRRPAEPRSRPQSMERALSD